MISLEQMLQVGYDCGLTHVSEAYSSVMSHYDAFFIIESTEMQEFNTLIENSGFLYYPPEDAPSFKNLTIVEAAKILNYTLLEMDDEYPESKYPESEQLDLFDTPF